MSPPRQPTGPRFAPRDLPEVDLASYVSRRASAAAWRYRARVTVHALAEAVAARINPAVGVVTAVEDGEMRAGESTPPPGDASPTAEADTRSELETEGLAE